MNRILNIFLFLCITASAAAQQTLSLDSCRMLALRNNKRLGISRMKQDVARNTSKIAKTKYLPKIDVMGGYEFTSKEISLLNGNQKNALVNIGTTSSTQLGNEIAPIISGLAQQGVLTPEQAAQLGNIFNKVGTSMGDALNHSGQRIVDAFDTDTRNMFMVSVMLKQPIYMGGAIVAANRIASINEALTQNETETITQNTIYETEQAYWTVVSLKHKQKLANSFLELVKKLDDDVYKMIREGVATRADGLKVDVKVNEAEMTVTQVENGLSLAKMYLCQLCGLPLDSDITLSDEENGNVTSEDKQFLSDKETAMSNRPELKMLENVVDISKQKTKIAKASYLPQIAMTAGYLTTNPNIYNGFENKFSGVWNVGVMVKIPVWNWFESEYKVRSSRIETTIANMEMDEIKEKIELQVSQSNFKVNEARRRLAMAQKNVKSADENLRCANIGFKEGVMQTTEVMEAQTAWRQAQSQLIDAEIEVKLCQINQKKALGVLKR
ncbi:MAG: TolC family protein [Prevotella sp.]